VSYFVLRQGLHPKVDWSHRREHVAEKGLTVEQANEALETPRCWLLIPTQEASPETASESLATRAQPRSADRRSRDPRRSGVRRYRVEGEQARVSSL
jgi:hypothetical protein